MSLVLPGFTRVYIPENITVHLGEPNEPAENVTIPFTEYIKNVASSELFPTWPENALKANIYAIISIALNRIYTEWYRVRGYNFDITNSTKYDQSYVKDRGVYDNISKIVDEIFTDYIVREGKIEPLFTTFCDGRVAQCTGMYQWGSVDLADEGYMPIDILKYYYGNDVEIIENAPVGNVAESYPGTPIKVGDSSIYVLLAQLALNRVSINFPAIPKIFPINGVFTPEMEESVKAFQRIFNLNPDGIIDKGMWYKLRYISTAVRKLAELASKGGLASEIFELPIEDIEEVVVLPYIQLIQYFLNILSSYYNTIPSVNVTGSLNSETRNSIMEFQKTMKLPVNGIVDKKSLEMMYKYAVSILSTIPPSAISLPGFLFPNLIYKIGSKGSGVYIIQLYLSYIAKLSPSITAPKPTGIFDATTETAVKEFQSIFGINPNGIVNKETWDRMVGVYQVMKVTEEKAAGTSPEPTLETLLVE